MPRSRLEIFDDAGHFPFDDEPLRFVNVLESFIDESEPASLDAFDLAARATSDAAKTEQVA